MNPTVDAVYAANESPADKKHSIRDTSEYTHECSLCKEQIKNRCQAINCLNCNYRTHMICITKKFKSVNSTQFRNAAEWMKEFLSFSRFAYVCESIHTTRTVTSATANKYGDSPSLPRQVHNLNVIMKDIHSKLEGFKTNIQSLLVANKQTTLNQLMILLKMLSTQIHLSLCHMIMSLKVIWPM